MHRQPLLLAGLALASTLLAGCGDDTEPSAIGASPAPEERIVSLSPTATEMLYAIGAGDQVVAADSYSNYPQEAPNTDLNGLEPNVEAIIGYEPDVVVAASDPGRLVDSLDKVDVETLILPAAKTLDDTYEQIEQLGAATGHVGDAAELVSQMQSEIEALAAKVPDGPPITYYHELDSNLYTVTGSTFIGKLYEMAGMRSIADDAPDAAGGYPQLSPEYVLEADPDAIFLADGAGAGGVTVDEIPDRPGWDALSAVRHDRVVEVDADIASRWGPRVVDYLRTLVAERSELQPVG